MAKKRSIVYWCVISNKYIRRGSKQILPVKYHVLFDRKKIHKPSTTSNATKLYYHRTQKNEELLRTWLEEYETEHVKNLSPKNGHHLQNYETLEDEKTAKQWHDDLECDVGIAPERDEDGNLTFRELFENDEKLLQINWYYGTSPDRVYDEYCTRYHFSKQRAVRVSTSKSADDGTRRSQHELFGTETKLYENAHQIQSLDGGLEVEFRPQYFDNNINQLLTSATEELQYALEAKNKLQEKETCRSYKEKAIHIGLWRKYSKEITVIKGTLDKPQQQWIKALQRAGILRSLNQYYYESHPYMFLAMSRIQVPRGMKRYFGVLLSVALNFDFPCNIHQDIGNPSFAHSIMVSFGKYFEGGELIAHDYQARFKTVPGSIISMSDRNCYHSSTEHRSKRYVMVLFTSETCFYTPLLK